MILYKLSKSNIGFLIVKFDDDFNAESIYELDYNTCSCPRGKAPTCRHRQMLPKMVEKVDTEWFYCFEDSTWHQPFGPANSFGEFETTFAKDVTATEIEQRTSEMEFPTVNFEPLVDATLAIAQEFAPADSLPAQPEQAEEVVVTAPPPPTTMRRAGW